MTAPAVIPLLLMVNALPEMEDVIVVPTAFLQVAVESSHLCPVGMVSVITTLLILLIIKGCTPDLVVSLST